MFFKRKIKKWGEETGEVETVDVVTCSTCGCLVEKAIAQEIREVRAFWGIYTNYYCIKDKKPYRRVEVGYDDNGGKLTVTSYFAEIRVSEDGTPVGYKKIKKGRKLKTK